MAAAAVTGIALLLPAALPAVIAAALVSLVAAPALALAADRMSAGTEQRLRSGVLRQVAAALDARAELHANSVAAPVLAAITRADRSATAASQRSAWAEGLGQGLTVLACGTAALASAVLAAPLGPQRRGRSLHGRRRGAAPARACGTLRGHHDGGPPVPGAA